jgi:hypothetical protein
MRVRHVLPVVRLGIDDSMNVKRLNRRLVSQSVLRLGVGVLENQVLLARVVSRSKVSRNAPYW